MSVDFTISRKNPEKGWWEQVPGTPEMNLCNSNASAVLAALGLDLAPDYCGTIEPADLLERHERFLCACEQGRGAEFTRSTTDTGERTDGPRVISYGLDLAGLCSRLDTLSRMAFAALAIGHRISWG